MGSIALGSFLIAVTTAIKVIFEYFAKQGEKAAGKDNVIYKCLICCVRAMIWCLDSCVKFISVNAYIQVALHNSTFCKGAQESFYLSVRHAGRFYSAQLVSFLMVIIGKGAITALNVWLTIMLCQTMVPEVKMPFIPALIVGIVCFVIASLFLGIFDSSSLAILHCFILSEDQGADHNIPDVLKGHLDNIMDKDDNEDKLDDPALMRKTTGKDDQIANNME